MKRILFIITLSLLCSLSAFAAGTVTIPLSWSFTPGDTNAYTVKLYLIPAPGYPATLVTNVAGVTNTTVVVSRPSDQYFYATASYPTSNETNYVADSDPSNLVRIRVLGNGTLRVDR
jgi:hypothetical protein